MIGHQKMLPVGQYPDNPDLAPVLFRHSDPALGDRELGIARQPVPTDEEIALIITHFASLGLTGKERSYRPEWTDQIFRATQIGNAIIVARYFLYAYKESVEQGKKAEALWLDENAAKPNLLAVRRIVEVNVAGNLLEFSVKGGGKGRVPTVNMVRPLAEFHGADWVLLAQALRDETAEASVLAVA